MPNDQINGSMVKGASTLPSALQTIGTNGIIWCDTVWDALIENALFGKCHGVDQCAANRSNLFWTGHDVAFDGKSSKTLQDAVWVLSEMQGKRVRPRTSTFNIIVAYFACKGMTRAVLGVISSMLKQGTYVAPNGESFLIAARQCSQTGDYLPEILTLVHCYAIMYAPESTMTSDAWDLMHFVWPTLSSACASAQNRWMRYSVLSVCDEPLMAVMLR